MFHQKTPFRFCFRFRIKNSVSTSVLQISVSVFIFPLRFHFSSGKTKSFHSIFIPTCDPGQLVGQATGGPMRRILRQSVGRSHRGVSFVGLLGHSRASFSASVGFARVSLVCSFFQNCFCCFTRAFLWFALCLKVVSLVCSFFENCLCCFSLFLLFVKGRTVPMKEKTASAVSLCFYCLSKEEQFQ